MYYIKGCWGIYLAVCLMVYCIMQQGDRVYLRVCWIVLDSILQNIGGVGVFLGVYWIVFCTFCTIEVGGCLKLKFRINYRYMPLFCSWTPLALHFHKGLHSSLQI